MLSCLTASARVRCTVPSGVVTSTLGLRTGFIPRWLAFFGLAVAATLLLASRSNEWMVLAFPLWVLLLSLYILVDNLGRHATPRIA